MYHFPNIKPFENQDFINFTKKQELIPVGCILPTKVDVQGRGLCSGGSLSGGSLSG